MAIKPYTVISWSNWDDSKSEASLKASFNVGKTTALNSSFNALRAKDVASVGVVFRVIK